MVKPDSSQSVKPVDNSQFAIVYSSINGVQFKETTVATWNFWNICYQFIVDQIYAVKCTRSMFGHVNIIKMLILAKFFIIYQSLPFL